MWWDCVSFTLLQTVYPPFSCCLTAVCCISPVSVGSMSAAARIGDQLILEEDYDENYIPSEQGTVGRGG